MNTIFIKTDLKHHHFGLPRLSTLAKFQEQNVGLDKEIVFFMGGISVWGQCTYMAILYETLQFLF